MSNGNNTALTATITENKFYSFNCPACNHEHETSYEPGDWECEECEQRIILSR